VPQVEDTEEAMTKALTLIGGIAILAIVAAYPVGAVIALAIPLTAVLGIVWWLTDSSVAVGRARGRTWFDHEVEPVGGWNDADQVASTPIVEDEPHTAEVVMKGARRADPRRTV
jgi:hypothetical protein